VNAIPPSWLNCCDWRIRASEETIMESLVGDCREEHIFTLRQ